jgi:hypothetical protein
MTNDEEKIRDLYTKTRHKNDAHPYDEEKIRDLYKSLFAALDENKELKEENARLNKMVNYGDFSGGRYPDPKDGPRLFRITTSTVSYTVVDAHDEAEAIQLALAMEDGLMEKSENNGWVEDGILHPFAITQPKERRAP